tara:strand:+ start:1723 stop:2280 length:558 start_codon:yes stop_codon:yes gene_type:complete
MEFNLTKYFRNQYLRENFKKNVWITLDKEEQDDFSDEIFDLINNAYAPIGGHPNYKSNLNVIGSEGDSIYSVIDLDDDPDIDAIVVDKKRAGGLKSVAMGHDGSSDAKRAAINIKAIMLKKPGHYIEVSGKLVDILKSKGVPIVADEETIRRVLKGKEIEMNNDGTYQRSLGGTIHTKTLMGNPL